MATPASIIRSRRASHGGMHPVDHWTAGGAAFDTRPRAERPSRRRRIALRAVPTVLGVVLVGFLIAWVTRSSLMTASEVAVAAHDQVQREVIERTGDYSTTIGPLDCTELAPGRGNCLADERTSTHQADGLMVAVAYSLERGSSDLHLVIKLP